jgi:diguanylate cyclase (GGDEF)-like protein/PAS domain S-box-containing protein
MDQPRREEILSEAVDTITDGVYFVDMTGRIGFWNKGAERITGYSREEVIGKRCSENVATQAGSRDCELCLNGCPLASTLEASLPLERDAYLYHKDGHRLPVTLRATPLLGPDKKTLGIVEIFTDRSERSSLLAELEGLRKEVLTDSMTGLGNRRYAELSLAAAFKEFRAEGEGFGILMLDIDRFKDINDNFGHAIGDRVLRMVCWTLANAVRRNDAAARWGGEEFLVVCPRIGRKLLAEVAERVRSLIEGSHLSLEDGSRVLVTVSIGGAIVRPDDDPDALVGRADERLYFCKTTGRNKCDVLDGDEPAGGSGLSPKKRP